jgi:hypothetical protein
MKRVCPHCKEINDIVNEGDTVRTVWCDGSYTCKKCRLRTPPLKKCASLLENEICSNDNKKCNIKDFI